MNEIKCWDNIEQEMEFFSVGAHDWEALGINLVYKGAMWFVKLHCMIDLLPEAYRCLIISRICYLLSGKKNRDTNWFMIPLKYAKHNTIAGACNTVMTDE